MNTRTTAIAALAATVLVACSTTGRKKATRAERGATADQWAGQTAKNAEELLAGRFPGVDVTPVPGGVTIRIRGASSVLGNGEPLFVIDGMQIQPGPGGALMGINPADIAKIEVLKDIGSTSRYGMQGANGVILITMKHAK